MDYQSTDRRWWGRCQLTGIRGLLINRWTVMGQVSIDRYTWNNYQQILLPHITVRGWEFNVIQKSERQRILSPADQSVSKRLPVGDSMCSISSASNRCRQFNNRGWRKKPTREVDYKFKRAKERYPKSPPSISQRHMDIWMISWQIEPITKWQNCQRK